MIRTDRVQFLAMVEYMERNGDLLRTYEGASGRLVQEKKWKELRDILNADPHGAQKYPDAWKKVWSDLKAKTKRKAANIKIGKELPVGEPRAKPLSRLEERVLAIMGLTKVADMPEVEEVGLLDSSDAFEFAPAFAQQELPPAVETAPPSLPSLSGSSIFQMDATETFPSEESIQLILSPPRTSPPSDPHKPRPPRSPAHSISPSPARSSRARRSRQANRPANSFDRAVSEFVGVENRRLRREEERDRMQHERDMAMVEQFGVIARSIASITDILLRHYGESRS